MGLPNSCVPNYTTNCSAFLGQVTRTIVVVVGSWAARRNHLQYIAGFGHKNKLILRFAGI